VFLSHGCHWLLDVIQQQQTPVTMYVD